MFRRALFLILILSLAFVVPSWADREVQDYSRTVHIFKSISGVSPFFNSAYGYAVFPTIGKGGFGVGAAHGKGQVYRIDRENGDEVTGFARLTEISLGFQMGGQAYRQIVFFEDERAYDEFTSGSFEFDASASAVAVTASADATAGTQGSRAVGSAGGESGSATSTTYYKGFMVFTVSTGGLMYEASIGGQKYSFNALDVEIAEE